MKPHNSEVVYINPERMKLVLGLTLVGFPCEKEEAELFLQISSHGMHKHPILHERTQICACMFVCCWVNMWLTLCWKQSERENQNNVHSSPWKCLERRDHWVESAKGGPPCQIRCTWPPIRSQGQTSLQGTIDPAITSTPRRRETPITQAGRYWRWYKLSLQWWWWCGWLHQSSWAVSLSHLREDQEAIKPAMLIQKP